MKATLTVKATSLLNDLEWFEEKYSEMCDRLQTCAQTHNLGLGGENVADLVCDEYDKAAAALRRAQRIEDAARAIFLAYGAMTKLDMLRALREALDSEPA